MQFSPTDRHILVITGEQSESLSYAKKLTMKLDCVLLDDPKKAQSHLGQEFDAVIVNLHKDFSPNAFGALTGTIRGGGYLVLLKPENSITESLFLKRFWSILSANKHHVIDPLSDIIELPISLRKKHSTVYASKDQGQAVEAIIHVVKGHRRRPLVITSDRGRGKSASLGIAAAKLFEMGYKNIIVSAPSKKTAAVIFKHALDNHPECHLTFYSPDELQQQTPKADVVLIDEAAAIPVPLLSSFLKHYSRIVFATTQHGYEGSGRGFAINFKKILEQTNPEWKSCKLTTPIRWNKDDSLEAFVFQTLLLNAEPAESNTIKNIAFSECKISQLNKTALLKNSSMLSELFGLLVSAHYQTKPSDLMQILDDDSISIHAIQYKQHIIAVALLIKEGGINSETATAIFEGTRRLQGHLVAQSLAANAGIETAPCLHGERVIRIAVHPNLQQQGFGSALLNSLVQNSKADYLSTSFGATEELINFWKKLSFTPVYLGMKRDASSGTHSVIMLYAKSDQGKELIEKVKMRLEKHFPYLLSEPFCKLEMGIVLALLTAPPSANKNSISENKELHAFAEKQRGYENTLYPIWNIVCNRLASASLNEQESKILVLKVLQKYSWNDVSKKMSDHIKGKKDALRLLRQAISKLLIDK